MKQLVVEKNSLEKYCQLHNLDLLLDWDVEKNESHTPQNTKPFSHYKAFWKCNKCGYEWEAVVSSRVSGRGCKQCQLNDKNKLKSHHLKVGINDLASLRPDLVEELDKNKNADINIKLINVNSNDKVWWTCSQGHSYQARVSNRCRVNSGCPYCSGNKVLEGFNDISTTNPEILVEWDYDKNEVKPTQVSKGSKLKVWWKCNKCDFSYQASIANRCHGKACPACGHNAVNSGVNDLEVTHPEVLQFWDYEKNEIYPSQVLPFTSKKAWWLCEKGHSYQEEIRTKVNSKTGCPYCSGRRVLKGFNDLESLYPNMIKEWDFSKNKIKPNGVTAHSSAKVWWLCEKGHSYQAQISNKTSNDPTGCPICSNREVLVGYNDLLSKNPLVAKEWNYVKNDDLFPNQVTFGSQQKVWWKCSTCGKEWKTTVYDRAIQGRGCPRCAMWYHTSKPEQILYYYVKQQFEDAENGFKYLDKYEIDVYIPSYKIGIEYDGERWHKADKIRKDEEKGRNISDEITFIRIREPNAADVNDGSQIIWTSEPNDDCSHMNNALKKLFKLLSEKTGKNINADIDVDRDYISILASFKINIGEKSLAKNYPQLISEWNYEKNQGLIPESVPKGSGLKVWWRCKQGHEWQATIASRVSGKGCRICYNEIRGEKNRLARLKVGENDLATKNPAVAKEWVYELNGEMNPSCVNASSPTKYWWKCSYGHTYEASVINRVKGRGCPYCAHKKVWKNNQ